MGIGRSMEVHCWLLARCRGQPATLLPSNRTLQVVAKAAAKASAQLDAAVEGYDLAEDELEAAHTQAGTRAVWPGLAESCPVMLVEPEANAALLTILPVVPLLSGWQVAAAARQQLLVHSREAANTALSRVKDRCGGIASFGPNQNTLPHFSCPAETNVNNPHPPHSPALVVRFAEVFQRDEQGMPRTWQPSVDIAAVTAAARRAAAQLLAQLCFVRSSEGGAAAAAGAAAGEAAVLRLADDVAGTSGAAAGGSGRLGRSGSGGDASAFDLQSAAEWPAGVSEEDVLLSPAQVRSIWRQFMSDSTFAVQQVRWVRAGWEPAAGLCDACVKWSIGRAVAQLVHAGE